VGVDRNSVERLAGRQIADLQRAGHVTDEQKRAIRRLHEQAAAKAAAKAGGGQ
jgi:hypothetical protein